MSREALCVAFILSSDDVGPLAATEAVGPLEDLQVIQDGAILGHEGVFGLLEEEVTREELPPQGVCLFIEWLICFLIFPVSNLMLLLKVEILCEMHVLFLRLYEVA